MDVAASSNHGSSRRAAIGAPRNTSAVAEDSVADLIRRLK